MNDIKKEPATSAKVTDLAQIKPINSITEEQEKVKLLAALNKLIDAYNEALKVEWNYSEYFFSCMKPKSLQIQTKEAFTTLADVIGVEYEVTNQEESDFIHYKFNYRSYGVYYLEDKHHA